jgi:hypothetical protein
VADPNRRHAEQGHNIDAAIVRAFIRTALMHDAVANIVHDLLLTHVVEDRYHPTVVAASLRPMLADVLDAASDADWHHVADELVTEAREAFVEAEPSYRRAHRRTRFWRRRRNR